MAKTVAFFDIDGVLNAFPFDRRWVGPSTKGLGMYDFALHDPKNWKDYELEVDPEAYFVLDQKRTFDYPSQYGGSPRRLVLRFSSELIERINVLIDSDMIDFYWLTTWRENAQSLAAPLFGMDSSLPSLMWYARGMSDYTQSGKANAIEQFYAGSESRRFVWIDDVATENYLERDDESADVDDDYYAAPWGESIREMEREERERRLSFPKAGVERLIIQTDPHFGISRSQWDAVEAFVSEV